MYESQISSLSNSFGITLENDISVITVDDNINHTYCSKIYWEQDNYLPIGTAKLIMPYSTDIEEYWIKYSGTVVIHANLNPKKNRVIASKIPASNGVSLNLKKALGVDVEEDKKEKKIRFKNDNYNYAFIGKTYRFKQVGKTFMVYLEDLGWKFLQKVPKEFRDTFIANQSLDDAFQAICEFIGVEFAYSIEDLSEYNFSADGYSIEKDGKVIEDVPSILKEWANGNEEDEEEDEEKTEDEKMADRLKDGKPFETEALSEYKKKKKNTTKNKSKTKSTKNQALNAKTVNKDKETDSTDENSEEKEDEDNEESVNEKIEKFQEEFDEKIKDLFIGNTFYNSNVSDPVMNYDWITITPKAPPAEATATGAAATGTAAGAANGQNGNTNIGWNGLTLTQTASAHPDNGWYGGQLYENGKIVLYSSYINSLGPAQARAKSQQTGTYTPDTIRRLRIRAQGVRV